MGVQAQFDFTFAPARCVPVEIACLGHNGGPPLDAPRSFAGDYCKDCGVPISAYSRGRCGPCADLARTRPIPDDFMIVLKQKGSLGAAAHYRASAATVTRWRRQMDLRPHARAVKRPVNFSARRVSGGFRETPLPNNRDWSIVGQAVEFLRRIGPVFRCAATGAATSAGEFWNRNGWVLSDEDVMSRATRLGWKPVEV